MFKFLKDFFKSSPQQPNVTVIVTFTPEEARRLASEIPDSIIVKKIRKHVMETGDTGLARDIISTYR